MDRLKDDLDIAKDGRVITRYATRKEVVAKINEIVDWINSN